MMEEGRQRSEVGEVGGGWGGGRAMHLVFCSLFEMFDLNRDGAIDFFGFYFILFCLLLLVFFNFISFIFYFSEFLHTLSRITRGSVEQKIKIAFQVCDIDGNG